METFVVSELSICNLRQIWELEVESAGVGRWEVDHR